MLVAVWCVRFRVRCFVVCCVLCDVVFVVCCSLFVRSLSVVGCVLRVGRFRCLLFIVCCLVFGVLLGVRWLVCVACFVWFAVRR